MEKQYVEGPMIKVRAKRIGFYDNIRRYPADQPHRHAGAPFMLKPYRGMGEDKDGKPVEKVFTAEEQFSPHWMERLDAKPQAQEEERRGPGRPPKVS